MLPQDNRNCWYVLNEREKQLVRQLDFDFLAKYGKDPALEKIFTISWVTVMSSAEHGQPQAGHYQRFGRILEDI